jgi:hypothetical protein
MWSIYCLSEEEINRARKSADTEIDLFENCEDKNSSSQLNYAMSFSIVENSLGNIITGLLVGNLETKLNNLMYKYPPTEVLFEPKRTNKAFFSILKNSIWNPNMQKLSDRKKQKFWSTMHIYHDIKTHLDVKSDKSSI